MKTSDWLPAGTSPQSADRSANRRQTNPAEGGAPAFLKPKACLFGRRQIRLEGERTRQAGSACAPSAAQVQDVDSSRPVSAASTAAGSGKLSRWGMKRAAERAREAGAATVRMTEALDYRRD